MAGLIAHHYIAPAASDLNIGSRESRDMRATNHNDLGNHGLMLLQGWHQLAHLKKISYPFTN